MNLQNKDYCPSLDEIAAYVQNPVFSQFCEEIRAAYSCKEKIEYSACSMEKGWNIKFRKSGRALCTVYPREQYFTVMVVVGQREKAAVEAILPGCTGALREIYSHTRECNGQRWLMIDLEDQDGLYRDVFRLTGIRRDANRPV